MPRETLRVRRKGTAMVPDYEAHTHVRRFHGWKHDPTLGEEFVVHPGSMLPGETPGARKRHGAWVGHDEVREVPMSAEYLRHLRDGDLWPADQATAQAAGVPFDPTFGEPSPVVSLKPAKES